MVRLTNSYIKPALKGGGGCEQSDQTEGLNRGFAICPQPLSRLAATAPRPGSLLAFCNHHPKAIPVYGGFEPSAVAPFGALYKLIHKQQRGRIASPYLHNLLCSPAARRISHCASNISLRISAISPVRKNGFHRGRKPATFPFACGTCPHICRSGASAHRACPARLCGRFR